MKPRVRRWACALALLLPFAVVGTGCTSPCVSGVGQCAAPPANIAIFTLDSSGSERSPSARRAELDDLTTALSALDRSRTTHVLLTGLGSRNGGTRVFATADVPPMEADDPVSVTQRADFITSLVTRARAALRAHAPESDQFGGLAFAIGWAGQFERPAQISITVLGDGVPAVPGLNWSDRVPSPAKAIREVRAIYPALSLKGARLTITTHPGENAHRLPPAYHARLQRALRSVCHRLGAVPCVVVDEIASTL